MGSGKMVGGYDGWAGPSLGGGNGGGTGAQGAQGFQGSTGAQGFQGGAGAQGSQGSQGSQGTTTFTPKQGANLTDANQTIQPGTDDASQYVQATNITASRTKTLGVTSVVMDALVEIVRTDSGAFTLLVVNGGTNGGTLFTFSASPTVKQGFTAFFNGVDWVAVGFTYYA